jgi:hypothetical protein
MVKVGRYLIGLVLIVSLIALFGCKSTNTNLGYTQGWNPTGNPSTVATSNSYTCDATNDYNLGAKCTITVQRECNVKHCVVLQDSGSSYYLKYYKTSPFEGQLCINEGKCTDTTPTTCKYASGGYYYTWVPEYKCDSYSYSVTPLGGSAITTTVPSYESQTLSGQQYSVSFDVQPNTYISASGSTIVSSKFALAPCPFHQVNDIVCNNNRPYNCVDTSNPLDGCADVCNQPLNQCGFGETCQDGIGCVKPVCNAVYYGNEACDNNQINREICVKDTNNQDVIYKCTGTPCPSWVLDESCGLGKTCKSVNTAPTSYTCSCPICTKDSSICTDGTHYKICNQEVAGSECRIYSPETACDPGQACNNGVCGCKDTCPPDSYGCDIDPVYGVIKTQCQLDNGCYHYLAVEPCNAGDSCKDGVCIPPYTIAINMKASFAEQEQIIVNTVINGKVDGTEPRNIPIRAEIYSQSNQLMPIQTLPETFTDFYGKASFTFNGLQEGDYYVKIRVSSNIPREEKKSFGINLAVNTELICPQIQYNNKLIGCIVKLSDKNGNPLSANKLTYSAKIKGIALSGITQPTKIAEGQYNISANTNGQYGILTFTVTPEITGLITASRSIDITVRQAIIKVVPSFPASGSTAGEYTVNFETQAPQGNAIDTTSKVTILNPDLTTVTFEGSQISGSGGHYSFKYNFEQPSVYYIKIVSSATGYDLGSTCSEATNGCGVSFVGGKKDNPFDWKYVMVGIVVIAVFGGIFLLTKRKKK